MPRPVLMTVSLLCQKVECDTICQDVQFDVDCTSGSDERIFLVQERPDAFGKALAPGLVKKFKKNLCLLSALG